MDGVQVQLWAKHNTSLDDVFMVPPGGLGGFRVFSERPVVSEFKDGNAIFHDPGFLMEWSARMEALGRTPSAYQYDELRETVMRIAEPYHARYLVAGNARRLCFPVEFSVRSFSVYLLGQKLLHQQVADARTDGGSASCAGRPAQDCPALGEEAAGPAAGS